MTLNQLLTIISSSTGIIVVFCLLEIITGKVHNRSKDDIILDIMTFALPDIIIAPVVVFIVSGLAAYLMPQYAGALAGTNWIVQLCAFLIFEDMLNYWFHRAAHTYPKLMWPFHQAHHTSEYMSASIVHRNSLLYNFAFPNQYTASFLVYLGFGHVFVIYMIVKNLVLAGAHSELRWDTFLYKYKVLSPIAWVVERTISTPATHFAHHARTEKDGVGHYNGNYSNLMFLWDVLFGTALITRKYPPAFGSPVSAKYGRDSWKIQFLYPIFKRNSIVKYSDVLKPSEK